jgi:hypothetical protein
MALKSGTELGAWFWVGAEAVVMAIRFVRSLGELPFLPYLS